MTRPTSIRRALSGLLTSAMLATLFAISLPATAAAAVVCTPTGFIRDGIDLTAAKINPPGTVTGDVDATGCNIGIYYGPASRGKVSKATVHNANYFGIVNNGGKVDVTKSTIRDIGEPTLNGAQHGIGISFVQDTLGSSGDIADNKVLRYQKGGIVVRGLGNKAQIKGNEVTGAGPVDFIAQNGIQVSDGAKADVRDNKVTGNSYTGAGLVSSGGILIFGGCGLAIVKDITIDKNAARRQRRRDLVVQRRSRVRPRLAGAHQHHRQGQQGLEQRREQHERLGHSRRGLPGRDQRLRQQGQDREEQGLWHRLHAGGNAAAVPVLHRHHRGDQPRPEEQQDHHELLIAPPVGSNSNEGADSGPLGPVRDKHDGHPPGSVRDRDTRRPPAVSRGRR